MQGNEQEQEHNGEFAGLHSPDNGHSCNLLVCCGCHIVPGHIVHFKSEVMVIVYQVPGDPESGCQDQDRDQGHSGP